MARRSKAREIADHACDILKKESLGELRRFVPKESSPIVIGEAREG